MKEPEQQLRDQGRGKGTGHPAGKLGEHVLALAGSSSTPSFTSASRNGSSIFSQVAAGSSITA
jgi:hypothetical protein